MKIYVISLLRSQDRRRSIKKQLDSLSVDFEFFNAIDAVECSDFPMFKNYHHLKRFWLTSGKKPSKGELGCYASHYFLWQRCIQRNEPIIIMEDDIEISSEFPKYLSMLTKLISKFDFLRLEKPAKKALLYPIKSEGSVHFLDNNYSGTRAYVISPNSANKLINKSKRWCMPVDNYIGSLYIHKMPSYIFTPYLVYNPENFDTTIQLGKEKKAPFYIKPTREIYYLYRKIRMKLENKKVIDML